MFDLSTYYLKYDIWRVVFQAVSYHVHFILYILYYILWVYDYKLYVFTYLFIYYILYTTCYILCIVHCILYIIDVYVITRQDVPWGGVVSHDIFSFVVQVLIHAKITDQHVVNTCHFKWTMFRLNHVPEEKHRSKTKKHTKSGSASSFHVLQTNFIKFSSHDNQTLATTISKVAMTVLVAITRTDSSQHLPSRSSYRLV